MALARLRAPGWTRRTPGPRALLPPRAPAVVLLTRPGERDHRIPCLTLPSHLAHPCATGASGQSANGISYAMDK
jgi:hypothetical protein